MKITTKNGNKKISLHLQLILLMLPLSSVAADIEMTLQCESRGTVSVLFAEYGLVTESWPPSSFEIGTRGKNEHLPSGRAVSVWHFSNGDRLFQVKDSAGWFAMYRDDPQGTLHQCVPMKHRILQAEDLPRVPYR